MLKQPIFQHKEAWVYKTYDNWCKHYGSPPAVAKEIIEDPKQKVNRILEHFGEVKGKRVIHLFGAGYLQAISLSLLGSKVTVVDVCTESVRYALEVARNAEVSIRYIVTDGMELPLYQSNAAFDLLVMEHGIFHYFYEINHFAQLCHQMLDHGGRFILRDFHPFHKLDVTQSEPKDMGNYFDEQLRECSAHLSYFSEMVRHDMPIVLRKWTMGEIITAFANNGFIIESLDEHPMKSYSHLPGSFTLVALKR